MSEAQPTRLEVVSTILVEEEERLGPRRDERGEPIPAGQILADRLAEGLAARGWKAEYRWTTYNSHALDAQRAEQRYDVDVSLADAESGRWVITARPRTGLLKRIFAGKVDPKEQALLRLDIDATLAGDARLAPGPWTVEDKD